MNLIRRIYSMTLERDGFLILGKVGQNQSDLSLLSLDLYVRGYSDGLNETHNMDGLDGWGSFINWLENHGYYPNQGWAMKIVEETGDGRAAYSKFKKLLFNFLEEEKPKWFIEFNLKEQPSLLYGIELPEDGNWKNAKSVPKSPDIRNQNHIEIAKNA